jgi:hypothetical protein
VKAYAPYLFDPAKNGQTPTFFHDTGVHRMLNVKNESTFIPDMDILKSQRQKTCIAEY